MKADTVAKQILFCTVRIENTPLGGGPATVGTGFVFDAATEDGKTVPLLISNKHVLRDAATLTLNFLVQNSDNTGPELGHLYRHNMSAAVPGQAVPITGHPDPEIDVAFLSLASIWNPLFAATPPAFLRAISWRELPTEDAFKQFDAVEELTFVGYPSGISDPANFTPIVRRAITATPMAIPFANKPTFLVDGAVFGGSSGSPVFILSQMWTNTTGVSKVGNRVYLVGIIAETYERYEDRPVQTTAPAARPPFVKTAQALNLGVAFSVRAIIETINRGLKDAGLPEGDGLRDYE